MFKYALITALGTAVLLSGCATYTPPTMNLYPITASPTMSQQQAIAVCEPRARLASSQISASGAQPASGYCPPGSPCAVQSGFNNFANSLSAGQAKKDALRMCLAEAGWAF